jgi:hypothetical protein
MNRKRAVCLVTGLLAAYLIARHVRIDTTEVTIAARVYRFITFYCIDPHCAGWSWWRPDLPQNTMRRTIMLDRKEVW